MQSKCKERKRPNKSFFFFLYFLPIKEEITKDLKETDEYISWLPKGGKKNLEKNCNSFFLKFQAKNKLKMLGNTRNL
jgi:hypothetical protein